MRECKSVATTAERDSAIEHVGLRGDHALVVKRGARDHGLSRGEVAQVERVACVVAH